MVEAIGSQLEASAAMNVLLRELGGLRRGRRSAPDHAVQALGPTSTIRGKSELTEEERRQVEKLKSRDREVRQHEAAHKAAAGAFAKGGASFEFTTGPDGRAGGPSL